MERLCAHRGVAVPAPGQVLDLAPVLDMRPADLLAIAGGGIPAEFMPAAPNAAQVIDSMVRSDGPLIAEAEALRDYARSLPRPDNSGGLAGLPPLESVTSGAVFTRLLKVRNLSREGMACVTGSALSTVGKAMRIGELIPQRLELMAATLCLRADDFDAIMVRTPNAPPANDWVRDWVPRLWAFGEVLLALAPLPLEQIKAVQTFVRRRHLSPP
ncbi:hypothetical protein [Dactylosporangium fulvum]|uniref:Uncharacterized protein n=1 Tax=Dactylosporangium fulvum TaxID=53359 RepID=A0ABY5VZU1_9ACTN|nr:hypothetical protein [Dactylosporangium fulvum]UWP82534.1 hypothetical protein Dfulv_47120 [Dactylosporangium fulvum]